jgi:glycosyltransferase involved in cell wall biosynthesis
MDTNKAKMKISLCLTTYNRTDLLYESFRLVMNDKRIDEIVIVDDASTGEVWENISGWASTQERVKTWRNQNNLDCYRNKREAISKASNEWVIILDSDNIITKEYLDRLEGLITSGLNSKTVYQPSFAKPNFNFTKYEGLNITRDNVAKYMHESNFQTMLNAMNYFVNRDEYLKVWVGSVDPVTSDSIFQNYNWLNAGNSIYVVPDLHYEHRIHEGSHYQNNVRRTPQGFHDSIVSQLKQMR